MYDLAQVDLNVYQGEPFTLAIRFEEPDGEPMDLTGMDAKMQVRKCISDEETLFEWTTTNSRIVIDIPEELLKFNVPETEINEIDCNHKPLKGVYDLFLYKDGEEFTQKFCWGEMVIYPRVTRI